MYNVYGDTMSKEIKLGEISKFQEEYLNNKENVSIEKNIHENGLKKASINKELEEKQKYRFNIQIPEIKIYDQKDSCEYNIYAFLRMIKSIMKKDGSINTRDLDLSATYIDFYDKLEKVNTFYNELLKENDITLDMINRKANKYIGVFGTFNFCKKIINKYGMVPTKYMPEVSENYDANLTIELLKDKVKSDAIVLIGRNGENDDAIKRILINEAYIFLSKVLGNPPTSFKYKNEVLTPLQFRNAYLKTSLDEYVTVTQYDKKILENSYSFIPSVYLKDNEEIITLSPEKIENAVINQLKDGIGVWFSAEESKTLDYDSNILDNNIFNYNELLQIRNIPNNYKLQLDMINYDHAMCITGALVKDKEVKHFKVDNSFGESGKYKGRLIMTNDFLKNCVITLIINKKYID